MARSARIVIPDQVHIVSQLGNAGQAMFIDDEDYRFFLGWLREAAQHYQVAVHAYALMPERLYFLATPPDAAALGRMMQWIGRHYVPYFNRRHGRSGTLWQGRFKASVVDAESSLLQCCRYIEMRQVWSGQVSHPSHCHWTSYAHHVGDRTDALITDHAVYWGLGNTPFQREAAYRQFLAQVVARVEIDGLSLALQKGQAIGSEAFKLLMEQLSGRRLRAARRGRPPKTVDAGTRR